MCQIRRDWCVPFVGDAVSKRLHLEKQEMYRALLPDLVPSNCMRLILFLDHDFICVLCPHSKLDGS